MWSGSRKHWRSRLSGLLREEEEGLGFRKDGKKEGGAAP